MEPVWAVRDDGRSGGDAELKSLKHVAAVRVRLRNSIMKLIHPTAMVVTPTAMQSADVVEIVPATIQTTASADNAERNEISEDRVAHHSIRLVGIQNSNMRPR
jgi:hypothetical protein